MYEIDRNVNVNMKPVTKNCLKYDNDYESDEKLETCVSILK